MKKKDYSHLVGTKINKLTILDVNLKNKNHFMVQCACGRIIAMNKGNILQKKTKSCNLGVCHNEFKDLTNKTFNYLKVIFFFLLKGDDCRLALH